MVEDRPGLGITPREERVDNVSRPLLSNLLFLSTRGIRERALDAKECADEAERDLCSIRVGVERLEKVPSRVGLILRTG